MTALLVFLGTRIATATPTCARRKASWMSVFVLYLLLWVLLHPWDRHPTPADESRGQADSEQLSIRYGPEGFQKDFVSLLELRNAARKLRLLREGVATVAVAFSPTSATSRAAAGRSSFAVGNGQAVGRALGT